MPVFGTILSVFVLPGESLTWAMGMGLIFAVVGIAVTNLPVKNGFFKKYANEKTKS